MSNLEPINECGMTSYVNGGDLKRTIQRKLESWNRPTSSREMLQVRLDKASVRRENAITKKATEAAKYGNGVRKRSHMLSTQKLNESVLLQEKLEAKQASANEKKQKLLRDCSERSSGKKDQDLSDSATRVISIEKKVEKKQKLAAENKEKIMQVLTGRVRTKMNKVSSLRAQQSAAVGALQGKLEEKHANIAANKKILLKSVSEKPRMQKKKYTQASLDKLKALESRSNQKQLNAARNKENLVLSVTTKVQEKMDKVSDLQMQKATAMDVLRNKLEEKQALASTKKEEVLKEVSEKPLLQKIRYAEVSQQKLMGLKEKLESKQITAAEKKENLVKSVTLRLQEKMNKVSSVQAQKTEAVESLQDKLFERHMLASTKKENLLQIVAQKPREQKERYSDAAVRKVNELEEKINQKQIQATEKKKKIDGNKALKFQEKMNKVSLIRAQNSAAVGLLQNKIIQKQMKASRKKLILEKSMSERSLGSLSLCSTFSVQEIQEQKVKAIEEKVEQKHSAAAENKENLNLKLSLKMKEKMAKVMNAQAQKIDALNARKVKCEVKHFSASINKENALKASSDKVFAKKERLAMSAVSSVKAVQNISRKNDAKMKAALELKSTIVDGIIEKSAKANRNKLRRSMDLEEQRKQKVKTLETNHKLKLTTAAEKKKNMLSEISTNVSFDTSKHVKELATKKTLIENELRLKHEDKLQSAQKRREFMCELEKEKMEVIRKRRDNIRKMKMLSRQNNVMSENVLLETTLETVPLGSMNVNFMQNSRNVGIRSSVKNCCYPQVKNGSPKYMSVLDDSENKENSVVSENTENKENNNGDGLQERRIAFRSQAAEEIRSAREVKLAELTRLAGERKEARSMKNKETDEFKSEYCLSLETISTANDSYDWEDTISYADTFDDQLSRSLSNVELERGTTAADFQKLEAATADLARVIKACDVKLSDIQLMQSLILAQDAANEGKNEFRTLENLEELDSIEMTFSSRRHKKDRLGFRIGAVSKRIPIITARLATVSKRAKPILARRVTKLTRQTRGGLQSLRSAAVKLDEMRRKQREPPMQNVLAQ